jgi:hypothetical protein
VNLREKRCYFTALVAKVIEWINSTPSMRVACDEFTVKTPRAVRMENGAIGVFRDAVHGSRGSKYSFHNEGLAVDLLIYRNGDYISDGGDGFWLELDNFCRHLDPLFGLGMDWHDANHLSYGESRKEPK